MNSEASDRRRFLKDGAVLAGLAAAGLQTAKGQPLAAETDAARPRDLHAYGERSRFENSVRIGNNGSSRAFRNPAVTLPYGPHTPLQDSVGIITPASLHYIISHGYEAPDIDPQKHRLIIHGMVDRPLIFTLEDLKRLPSVTRVHFMECRANGNPYQKERKMESSTVQITHGLTSCSEWTGVPMSLLLKEAGVKKGAGWLIAQGADTGNHTKSIPIEKAMEDGFVAYGMNGEAVRPEQGYPLRLLMPGWQGINSVKWLRRIKLVEQPYMDIRESTQYVELRPDGKARWFVSELGPNSVITRPSSGQQLPGRGFYQITGLAWSGGGAIKRVEVSTDGGKSWKDAELQGPVHRKAHTRFNLAWNWNGEEVLLKSRCTDETGGVQPSVAEMTKIWDLPANYFDNLTVSFGNFNAIQTWKVNRDGSIQNAMLA